MSGSAPWGLLIFVFLLSVESAIWSFPTGSIQGHRYAPLFAVNTTNVQKLEISWQSQWNSQFRFDRSPKSTPILVQDNFNETNLLITCSQNNEIVAYNATSGVLAWSQSLYWCIPKGDGGPVCRGVSYWENPKKVAHEHCKKVIFMASMCSELVAVDALDGKPCDSFGKSGVVTIPEQDQHLKELVGVTAPPFIMNGVVISGSFIVDFKFLDVPKGEVWAFDAETGKRLWSFLPIPIDESDPSFKTWENGTKQFGGGNVWGTISGSEELGLVFLPTSSPSDDLFGAFRGGTNMNTDSVVAVELRTGKVKWSFQTVRHDLWDYDVGAQPIVTKLRGRVVVVVATKLGYIFLLDGATGVPISPVEDMKVPMSDVYLEKPSPTQPIPSNPNLRLGRYQINEETLWGPNPTEKGLCLDFLLQLAGRQEGKAFTPPSRNGSLWNPGSRGGFNWGSCGLNGTDLYCTIIDQPLAVKLLSEKEFPPDWCKIYQPQRGCPFGFCYSGFESPNHFPCVPPPWSRLIKINIETEKVIWDVPLGFRDNPNFQKSWGSPNLSGGILISGHLIFTTGTEDKGIHVFDGSNGEEIHVHPFHQMINSAMMSYQIQGKQYFAFTSGEASHPMDLTVMSVHS